MQDSGTSLSMHATGVRDYLDLLRGRIDISTVPFSDRGSRLVVQQSPGRSALHVRLGERLTVLDSHPEAYLGRSSFLQPFEFVDQHGEVLPFDCTGSPDVLHFQTRIGGFKLVFQDGQTLAVGLPPDAGAGIRFSLNSEYFRPGGPGSGQDPVRSLAYAASEGLMREQVTPHAHGLSIELIMHPGSDRTILLRIAEKPRRPLEISSFSELQQAAARRWEDWFAQIPPVAARYAEKYAYSWWVLANNLISTLGCIRYEAAMPSKAGYIGLWLWDSALHAIAYRHTDPQMARNQIRAFLAMQQEDGMLPDAIFDDAAVCELDHPVAGRVTKPPILAWAAMKVHQAAPDLDFLREIYPGLKRWTDWWFEANDDDRDGLAQYSHPYSSGLDDSPLWDHGLPVESPDLNTYLVLGMQSLAEMAGLLGMSSESRAWGRRAETLTRRMLEDMWDEEAGLFRALHNEMPLPVATPVNLLPLWTARLPARVVDRLVDTLTDRSKFWGYPMLPSVARDDPAFDPQMMWRGPVWANLNYFMIEALGRASRKRLAEELRDATLKLIMSQPGIYEYYDARDGTPPEKSVPAFGWTSAVFIDLALQASGPQKEPAASPQHPGPRSR